MLNVSRAAGIQHVNCVPYTPPMPFSRESGVPFIASWLASSSVTKRASDDQRLKSSNDTIFVAQLSNM